MDYIDFGDRQKIPKEYVQNFMDVYSWLKWDIEKNSIEKLQWEDHMDRIHKRFEEIPHKHYSSILGPYCVACHCSLPGPNGEWE